MDIAVVGACGDVGRQIAQHVIVERLLLSGERLVLVGNREGSSARSAYGLAADLTDAYAEICPEIEVILDPEEIRADLIIVAAGATPKPTLGDVAMTRDWLAETNAPIFRAYARAIADRGNGHEIVVCVSNPNELAVGVFSAQLGRSRVIGMGSFLDSLRFRKEIASDLGVRRQAVHAFVVGEHGSGAVPLWSGVHVYGYTPSQLEEALAGVRASSPIEEFPLRVAEAERLVGRLILAGDVRRAYEAVDRYPPDVRVVVRPFVTHYSGAKTVTGTARATMEFLRTISQGSDALVCGQVALDGEVYGIRGSIGTPFVVGNQGVDRLFELPMSAPERDLFIESAARVQQKLEPYL